MVDHVARQRELLASQAPLASKINPLTNVEGSIATLAAQRDADLANLPQKQIEQQGFDVAPAGQAAPSAQIQQRAGLPPITQTFGQKSKFDVFSGGVNYGVDFGIKAGTPVGLPPGQWDVIEAYGGARGQGKIGNKTNRGYGNSVLVRNAQTGESLRLSHLNNVGVRQGQRIPGGTVIATSGATGNVTGPHLDVEYKDSRGKLGDVLKTPYAKSLVGK